MIAHWHPMNQFYTYTLSDGRRALVDAHAGIGLVPNFMTGFGRVVNILPPLKGEPQ